MLYGAGVPNEQMMKTAPQIGVSTVWWEGNPCNTHRTSPGRNWLVADTTLMRVDSS